MNKIHKKTVAHLQNKISRLVNKPVQLAITDNTCSMISIRPSSNGYNLRLHHMFLDTDTDVIASLAHFIKGRSKKAPSLLRDFVRSNSNKIRKSSPRPRRTVLRSNGRFFDLNMLFDQVNAKYFNNKIDCSITWGPNRRVTSTSSKAIGDIPGVRLPMKPIFPSSSRRFTAAARA